MLATRPTPSQRQSEANLLAFESKVCPQEQRCRVRKRFFFQSNLRSSLSRAVTSRQLPRGSCEGEPIRGKKKCPLMQRCVIFTLQCRSWHAPWPAVGPGLGRAASPGRSSAGRSATIFVTSIAVCLCRQNEASAPVPSLSTYSPFGRGQGGAFDAVGVSFEPTRRDLQYFTRQREAL